MIAQFDYSKEHPHYTPGWLSEALAKHIPADFSGVVVDPACGAGNLLAAAALTLDSKCGRSNRPRFVGYDISDTAISACTEALSRVMKKSRYQIIKSDFLAIREFDSKSSECVVVMNPPFKGYGTIPRSVRQEILKSLGLRGRFNLSHAFVKKAAIVLRPTRLIALLPSHWYYSRASGFPAVLRDLGGSWIWTDIGDAVFAGVSAHVGVLVWTRDGRKTARPSEKRHAEGDLVVRQGVATGRDWVFRELADLRLPVGNVVNSVVGRDVGRASFSPIWLPPKRQLSNVEIEELKRQVPSELFRELDGRACVRAGGRSQFDYHEAAPSWFLGSPKILIPEILNGELRSELDSKGSKLPLHSVFAVRLESIAQGKKLLAHMRSPEEQRRLRSGGAKLSGGASRLNVHLIRDSISRFK